MSGELFLLAIIFGFVALIIYQVYEYYNQQYKSFVIEHSTAIKELTNINAKYHFHTIPNYNMANNYDNDIFYDNISPKDYLTYQLVYKQKDVITAINNAAENQRLYSVYINRVKNCTLDIYDTDKLPRNRDKLISIEKQYFHSNVAKPTIGFSITVRLVSTKINGRFVDSKSDTFSAEDILEIIERLKQKHGDFYLNDDVWQAICRVERGRVSNKMRFAIYERDGHRCRKCGRATQDLEIDHIFPISKGGKSTFDNLQTLCHRCNALKSNTVEYGSINPKSERQGVKGTCDYCGAPLVRRNGKYGDFYGCSNYPKCRFTKQLK